MKFKKTNQKTNIFEHDFEPPSSKGFLGRSNGLGLFILVLPCSPGSKVSLSNLEQDINNLIEAVWRKNIFDKRPVNLAGIFVG